MKLSFTCLIYFLLFYAVNSFAQFSAGTYSNCSKLFYKQFSQVDRILSAENGINYQLNMWDYSLSGKTKLASDVEVALKETIEHGEIIHIEKIGTGASGAKLITLDNEVQGVLKTNDSWNADVLNEVGAYHVDKVFGFNMVPLTVTKKIGDDFASVQLFVRDAKMAGQVEFSSIVKEELGKLDTLDFLLQNTDRQGGNFLVSKEGKVIAIDHGLTMKFADTMPLYEIDDMRAFFRSQEGIELMERLKVIDDDLIIDSLDDFYDSAIIEGLLERKEILISLFG